MLYYSMLYDLIQNVLMPSVYDIYLYYFCTFFAVVFFILPFIIIIILSVKQPPNFVKEVLNPVTGGTGSGPRIINFKSETSRTKSFLGVDQNPGLFSIKLRQRQYLQKLFAI